LLRRVVGKKYADVSEVPAAYIMALTIRATSNSKTSAYFFPTTRRNNPQESHLQELCKLQHALLMFKGQGSWS
jgi:hypothetical protein